MDSEDVEYRLLTSEVVKSMYLHPSFTYFVIWDNRLNKIVSWKDYSKNDAYFYIGFINNQGKLQWG